MTSFFDGRARTLAYIEQDPDTGEFFLSDAFGERLQIGGVTPGFATLLGVPSDNAALAAALLAKLNTADFVFANIGGAASTNASLATAFAAKLDAASFVYSGIGGDPMDDAPLATLLNARVKFGSGAPATAAEQTGLYVEYGRAGKKGQLWFNNSKVGDSGTFAEMMAIVGPEEGDQFFVTTVDLQGTVGVYTINTPYMYTGGKWRPMNPVRLKLNNTATLTNTQTAFQASATIIPPVDFILNDMTLSGQMFSQATLNGAPTYTPQIFSNGALLCNSNNATDVALRMTPYMWAHQNNRLTSANASRGMDDFVIGTTFPSDYNVQAADFNGTSVSIQFGCTFSATGSDTQMQFKRIDLELF